MEENKLVPKKLGFFQRIRKAFYLRGMNAKKANKYYSLPDYLKQDDDVVNAVVNADERLINYVLFGKAKTILKQNPELLNKFYDVKKLNEIFNESPELIAYYENPKNLDNIYNFIYNNKLQGNREFIRYLSKDLQLKLISQDIEYTDKVSDNQSFRSPYDSNTCKGSFYDIKQYLDKFSEEVFIDFAVQEELRIKEQTKKGSLSILENKVLEFDLEKLSIETQLKLLLISEKFKKKVSDEALIKFVNGNPLLFDKLSDKLKEQMISENPEILSKMPYDFQTAYVKYNPDKFKDSKCNYMFNIRNFDSPEKAADKIILIGGIPELENKNITDIRNDDYIWEMGKFNPEYMKLNLPDYLSNINNLLRNKHIVKNLYNHAINSSGNNELTKYLESLLSDSYSYGRNDLYTEKGIEKINRLGKMLLNEDIMQKVSGDIILDYAQNPSQEKLIEIIRNTYGDTSAKILEDRPKMNLELIPNLYIFKPEIVNEFGIGAIHANLSYSMNTSGVLSELARKPELMQKYKMFNESTKDMFSDTAVGLEDKLTSFVRCKELMENVDFNILTEKQKENLQIALLDSRKKSEPEVVSFPKNMQELDEYTQKRNALYDDAIKKEKDIKKLKQLVSKRFFGLDYNPDLHYIELSNPSVWGMSHFYNLGRFVNNPITLQGEKFSEEELDSLELLDIFTQIDKPEVLVELAEKLSQKENVINPMNYKELQQKVPMQYNQEMVNSLLTPEKALKMIEDGVPGIEKKEVDGVTVITLNGADFKLYISNPFMNNSGIGSIDSYSLAKEWKEKEDGISTFSGCVVDQTEMKSCVSKGDYGLGFSNISPYQIVGMGITDIHTSHYRREISPHTTEGVAVTYDYPEEFMRKVSRRLNFEDPYSDPMHQYDEMAALRVEKYLSKIKEGTFGGKILADYIFMNGTNTDAAVEQAKNCGINFVFAFDEEKYRYRDRSRIHRNPEKITPRNETEFMREIKHTVQGEDNDGRE